MKKIDALPIASLKEQLTAEIAPIDSALKKEAAEKAAKEKAAQEAAQAQAEKPPQLKKQLRLTIASLLKLIMYYRRIHQRIPIINQSFQHVKVIWQTLAIRLGIGRLVSKKRSLQPQLLAAMSLKGLYL